MECGFDHRFCDRVRHLFGIGDQRAVALATIALAFFPPRAYVRRIQHRAAHQESYAIP